MQSGFHQADSDGNVSWRAPKPPEITTVDLQVCPEILRTNINRRLRRRVKVTTRTMTFHSPTPKAISVPIVASKLCVRSFTFAEPSD